MQLRLSNRETPSTALLVVRIILACVLGLLASPFVLFGNPGVGQLQANILIACFIYSIIGILLSCGWSITMMAWGVFLGTLIPMMGKGGAIYVSIWATVYGLAIGGTIGLAAGVAVDYLKEPPPTNSLRKIGAESNDSKQSLRRDDK